MLIILGNWCARFYLVWRVEQRLDEQIGRIVQFRLISWRDMTPSLISMYCIFSSTSTNARTGERTDRHSLFTRCVSLSADPPDTACTAPHAARRAHEAQELQGPLPGLSESSSNCDIPYLKVRCTHCCVLCVVSHLIWNISSCHVCVHLIAFWTAQYWSSLSLQWAGSVAWIRSIPCSSEVQVELLQ